VEDWAIMLSVSRGPHGALVLSVQGELCIDTLGTLESCLDAARDCGEEVLVLDLAEAKLLSAAAIGLLVRVDAELRATGGSLVLRGAHGIGTRALAICEMDRLCADGSAWAGSTEAGPTNEPGRLERRAG
jgi:anti-anti-sigma factor